MDVFCQPDDHARVTDGDDYAGDFAADRVFFQEEINREFFGANQNDGGGVRAAVFEDGHDADVNFFAFLEHLVRVDTLAADVIPGIAFLTVNVCDTETNAVVFNTAHSGFKDRIDSKAASEIVSCFHTVSI